MDLQEILKNHETKLKEAQDAQADLLRRQRELDDEKRELELTVERRVQTSIEKVRVKARQEAEEALSLKVTEKEEQISSMKRQIEQRERLSGVTTITGRSSRA